MEEALKEDIMKLESETVVQRKIYLYLENNGWFVLRLTKTNISGIPDLIALKKGYPPFFIECKRTKGGVVSKLQDYWIRKLNRLGFVAIIANSLDVVKNEERIN